MKLTSGETEIGVKRLKLSTVKKISRAEIALVIEGKEQIQGGVVSFNKFDIIVFSMTE